MSRKTLSAEILRLQVEIELQRSRLRISSQKPLRTLYGISRWQWITGGLLTGWLISRTGFLRAIPIVITASRLGFNLFTVVSRFLAK